MGDVQITGTQTAGNGTQMSLQYKQFGETVITRTADGTPGETARLGFDFSTFTPDARFVPNGVGDYRVNDLALQTSAYADLDYYIRFDSTGPWLKFDGLSMGTAAIGRFQSSDASFYLDASTTLTTLLATMFNGQPLSQIEVEAYNKAPTPVLVDEYHFNQASVTGMSSSRMANNVVSVAFDQFTHSHVDIGTDGKAGVGSGFGYDFVKAVAIPPPVPSPTYRTSDSIPAAETFNANAALHYYLRYTEVGGNPSQWVAVDDLTVGFSAPRSNAPGGAVKASAGEMNVALGTGDSTAQLMNTLLQNHKLSSVEVEAYRTTAGSAMTLVEEYRLGDVSVVGLGSDGNSNGLILGFTQFGQAFVPIDAQGNPGRPTTVGFDFTQSMPDIQAQPNARGDYDSAHLSSTGPSADSLHYYVKFDGAGGWVALEGFGMAVASVGSPGGSRPFTGGASLLLGGASAAVVKLLGDMVNGRTMAHVEIEAYTLGSKPVLVDEYFFNTVAVDGLSSVGVNSNSVSIQFVQFTHGHVNMDANGHLVTGVGTGYDFATGMLVEAPVPVATLVGLG